MRYLVAMSGGVDSSAAALVLKEAGHYVEGAIMLLSPTDDGSGVASARAVCDVSGIKLNVLDMRKEFEESVIKPFCCQYLDCKTPNPCVFCNNKLKFGAFLDHALASGFDGIATGHYARIVEKNGRYAVAAAESAEKDQSYFLWDLPQEALSKTVFPLGEMKSKDDVRELARKAGLPSFSRSDSQDICFVKNGEYAQFITGYTGIKQPEGDFVDENGKALGRHNGLLNYTIGQRRYLNVAAGKRIFVLSKNADKNEVVLGDGDGLYRSVINAEKVRLQLYDRIDENRKYDVKIRYGKKTCPAYIKINGDKAEITFDTPQRAPAPGQSVVFYDGNTVVGGGFIC